MLLSVVLDLLWTTWALYEPYKYYEAYTRTEYLATFRSSSRPIKNTKRKSCWAASILSQDHRKMQENITEYVCKRMQFENYLLYVWLIYTLTVDGERGPDESDIEIIDCGNTSTPRCPVSFQKFTSPVRNTHCGHIYEKWAIMIMLSHPNRKPELR